MTENIQKDWKSFEKRDQTGSNRMWQPKKDLCAGVPARVKLPVAATIHDTVNTMSRDLQSQLRKQNYNFERADKVLADLGVRISRKNQPKKGKYNNTPPKGQKRSAEGPSAAQEEAVANKRTCTDPQGSEAAPSQATAETAVAEAAAGDAQAESLLHVPTTSPIALGAANPTPLPTGQTPADSAPEPLPPSGPKADAPTSQTSLAAAAAAAMGGPSVSSTQAALTPGTDEPGPTQPTSNAPSHAPAAAQTMPVSSSAQNGLSGGTQTTHTSAQQPKPPAGNFSSDRGVSHLNGNASSRRQPADGESVKLFDVNR